MVFALFHSQLLSGESLPTLQTTYTKRVNLFFLLDTLIRTHPPQTTL